MRDAFVAALSLNVFHRHTDRIVMANIAQVVNVLQSMILTDQVGTGHMVLTPTYHVFQMYTPFMEATYLPVDLKSETIKVRHEYFTAMDETKADGYRTLPLLSASAAKTKEGTLVLSLTNVSLDKEQELSVNIEGFKASSVGGKILTAPSVADYNDFDHPERVAPRPFKDAKLKKGTLSVKLPAKSIIVLELK